MTKAERNRRKRFFPFTWQNVADKINAKYATERRGIIISADTVRKVINGQRTDHHGIIEVFKAMTDAEQKRRAELSSRISKELEA